MNNDIVKMIDSKTIFDKDKNLVKIVHNGSVYLLRNTKDNKLILTK